MIAIPCVALSLVGWRQYFQVQAPWNQIFDFTIIGFEKDGYRQSLTNSSLEGVLQRKQLNTQPSRGNKGFIKPLVQTNQPSRGNTDVQA